MAELVVVSANLMDIQRFRQLVPELVVVRPHEVATSSSIDPSSVVMVDVGEEVDLAGVVARSARVVAYGPHVDRERLDAARAAGCHDVLPRSAVARWLATFSGI